MPGRILSATVLVLTLCLPTSARAQKSTTRGFNVGLHIQGASLSVEGESASEGGGGGLHVGYGVNRIVTLFADLSGSSIDLANPPALSGTWAVGHFDLGVRVHVADARRRLVPYVEGAVGARAVAADVTVGGVTERVEFSGSTLSLGGGLDIYLSQRWALDANVRWSKGEFNEITIGNISLLQQEVNADSARLKLGVIWWT